MIWIVCIISALLLVKVGPRLEENYHIRRHQRLMERRIPVTIQGVADGREWELCFMGEDLPPCWFFYAYGRPGGGIWKFKCLNGNCPDIPTEDPTIKWLIASCGYCSSEPRMHLPA